MINDLRWEHIYSCMLFELVQIFHYFNEISAILTLSLTLKDRFRSFWDSSDTRDGTRTRNARIKSLRLKHATTELQIHFPLLFSDFKKLIVRSQNKNSVEKYQCKCPTFWGRGHETLVCPCIYKTYRSR